MIKKFILEEILFIESDTLSKVSKDIIEVFKECILEFSLISLFLISLSILIYFLIKSTEKYEKKKMQIKRKNYRSDQKIIQSDKKKIRCKKTSDSYKMNVY